MLLIIDIFKILGFITLFLCSEVGIAVMNAISNYIMEKTKKWKQNSYYGKFKGENIQVLAYRELEVMLNMELPNYRSVYCTKDRCLQIWECLCYCAWQLSLAGPQW